MKKKRIAISLEMHYARSKANILTFSQIQPYMFLKILEIFNNNSSPGEEIVRRETVF